MNRFVTSLIVPIVLIHLTVISWAAVRAGERWVAVRGSEVLLIVRPAPYAGPDPGGSQTGQVEREMIELGARFGSSYWRTIRDGQIDEANPIAWYPCRFKPGSANDSLVWSAGSKLVFHFSDGSAVAYTAAVFPLRCGITRIGCGVVDVQRGYLGSFSDLSISLRDETRVLGCIGIPAGRIQYGTGIDSIAMEGIGGP